MADFLTTRQLQELLQVDRTTIYRMADAGRVPALKVGNQWRFPSQKVYEWLETQAPSTEATTAREQPAADLRDLLPIDCVQLIQDTVADLLGVMVVITDLCGRPVTRPSNEFGLFRAVEAATDQNRCLELWAQLGRIPSLEPAWIESHLGLLCARGLIRAGAELRGMVVVGGVAPQDWPPPASQIDQIAADLAVDSTLIRSHAGEVFRMTVDEQTRALSFVQRTADIVTHIISERNHLFSKLNDIAALTKI